MAKRKPIKATRKAASPRKGSSPRRSSATRATRGAVTTQRKPTQAQAAFAAAVKVRATQPAPPIKAAPAKPRAKRALFDGLELILDVMPPGARLRTETPAPGKGRTPWILIGHIKFGEPISYQALADAFADVADSRAIERAIGRSTLARIQVEYEGRTSLRSRRLVKRAWTVAEIGAWGVVIYRAADMLGDYDRDGDDDDDDDDEPDENDPRAAKRYSVASKNGVPASVARGISIWLSSATGNETGVF